MFNRSLYTLVSGMKSMQASIQSVANNLANSNTTAFKKDLPQFSDLMYITQMRAGGPVSSNSSGVVPTGIQWGSGSKVVSVSKDFSQGAIETTDNPLNIAIQGEGFLVVELPDGTSGYTRDGNLHIDPVTNQFVTSLGYIVDPGITVPRDYKRLTIKRNGTVLVEVDSDPVPQEIGRISLAKFVNNSGLEAVGDNLYLETDASGEAIDGFSQDDASFGIILQGALEKSNVETIKELISMMEASRAFEMGFQVLKTIDEMSKTATSV